MAYPHVHSVAAIALMASLTGCVGGDADANIVILRNQAQASNLCIASADPEGAFNSSGVIDLRSAGGYVFTPIVQNFASAVEGDSTSRIAFLRGARVDIHFSDEAQEEALAGTALTRFEVPLSGSISPGGTAGLIFEIVPAQLLESVGDGDIMLVDIRMVGEMDGGGFEGAVFRYPIEVCASCTVQNIGSCDSYPTDFTGAGAANGCNVYQDSAVECCEGVSGLLVCPAAGTMQ